MPVYYSQEMPKMWLQAILFYTCFWWFCFQALEVHKKTNCIVEPIFEAEVRW